MRIVCISDTHSLNERIMVPDGDVLIHAGDLTDAGTLEQILDAYAWLGSQPHQRVIVTAGNHDFGMQHLPQLRDIVAKKFPKIDTLLDSDTMLNGLRVWGSPWQPWFHDWAFNFLPGRAGEEEAEERWAQIPDDTTVLVTHGPPYGMLDKTARGQHVGCSALATRVATLDKLRLHVFGHIHAGYGTQRVGRVLCVNACICDSHNDPKRTAIVLDFDESGARLAG